MLGKLKETGDNYKVAASCALVPVITAMSAMPVFAEGETAATGYLSSSVFSGISANLLQDINTNVLPNAWPIFGIILAVGIGMRIFKKVC